MGGFNDEEKGKWYYEDEMSDELFSHSVFPTDLEIDMKHKNSTRKMELKKVY